MKEVTNRYYVTFNDPQYNAEYSLSIIKSGCFNYGNGTAVKFQCNGKTIDVMDTRYDTMVMRDFDGWCMAFLNRYFDPDLEPQIAAMV